MLEGLLQPTHLLIIVFVALFVFGPKKLPELGKGFGQGIRSFREGIKPPEQPGAPAVEEKQASEPNDVL